MDEDFIPFARDQELDKDNVFLYLLRHGPCTLDMLAEAFGLPPNSPRTRATLLYYLRRLEEEGEVCPRWEVA